MNGETAATGKGGSIPAWAHVVCGWALIMVAFGGAIGGGLGGAAYGVNVLIFKSRLPIAVKVVLIALTGLGAIALWALIASAIHSARR
jgi:hypothetical protein